MEINPTRDQGEEVFFRGTRRDHRRNSSPQASGIFGGKSPFRRNFGEGFRTEGDYVQIHLDDEPMMPHDHRNHIRLQLNRQDWFLRPQLGDESFPAAPAGMSLSPAFVCNFFLHDHLLSNQELSFLGLSAHAAWELAARRMLAEIRTSEGYGFQHRPASFYTHLRTPGHQLRFPSSAPSSWLAHPRTLTLLDSHFQHVLESPVMFLSPEPGLLFAIPTHSPREPWEEWLKQTYGRDQEFWLFRAHAGFPKGFLLLGGEGRPTGTDEQIVAERARTFEAVAQA